MARSNQEWEALGRNVQDIIDRAVNSQDYRKLNQTIRQTVGRAVDLGSEAVRRVLDDRQEVQKPPVVEQQDLSLLYGNSGSVTTRGIAKIVGGSAVFALTVLLMLAGLILVIAEGSVIPMVLSLTGMAGGIRMICSGVGNLNMVSRFKTYRKTLGQKTHCSLEKLARSVHKNVPFVRKELEKLIKIGLLPEGHLDKEETMLITSHATYRYFENSRLELEERKRREAEMMAKKAASSHTPQVREVLDKGEAFVAEIRRCNDAIPGEDISRKIDRMEHIVARIFDRADANPEVIPDLKKMMDYYLPMTVKLLRAYADMDAQPVQGETIRNSKREIEDTLDTLNLAFEKLLDELFADTAVDISSDISVLQTLLAQEGLVEDDLSKLKEQNNT